MLSITMLTDNPQGVADWLAQSITVLRGGADMEGRVRAEGELVETPPSDRIVRHLDALLLEQPAEQSHELAQQLLIRQGLHLAGEVVRDEAAEDVLAFLREVVDLGEAAALVAAHADPAHRAPEVLLEGHDDLVHQGDAQSADRLEVGGRQLRLEVHLAALQHSQRQTADNLLGPVHRAIPAGDLDLVDAICDATDNLLKLNLEVVAGCNFR
jgi:hypothetical protein